MKAAFEMIVQELKDQKTKTLSIWSILFAVTIYLVRGGGDEFSLFLESLSILVVFFCAIFVPAVGITIFFAGRLVYKVIRHRLDKNGSHLPLLLLVSGTFLASVVPTPPIAEEASFTKHRTDYEYVVALAKSNQLVHGNRCLADSPSFQAFEVPGGFEHLSESCIYVHDYAGNINVEFTPYRYSVALNYFENPSDLTKSRDCDFRGSVWSRINENWYVCKLSHTW